MQTVWAIAIARALTTVAVVCSLCLLYRFFRRHSDWLGWLGVALFAFGFLYVSIEILVAANLLIFRVASIKYEFMAAIAAWFGVLLQVHCLRAFADGVDQLSDQILLLEVERAIEQGEMVLHYQPIVALRAGYPIVGYEALIRWQHPELGLIYPGDFIGVVERYPLICKLFDWVLNEACRQSQQWGGQKIICLNIAPTQFEFCNLLGQLQSHSGQIQGMHLEITEQCVSDSLHAQAINLLKTTGCKIVLDDFGVGAASYSRLAQLPVDIIKLDRSFMADGQKEYAVYKSLVDLVHALHLPVVGEGVETAEQAQRLQSIGCDYAQGYFFGKPMSPEHL